LVSCFALTRVASSTALLKLAETRRRSVHEPFMMQAWSDADGTCPRTAASV
jgi:hypothetical protein